jgi:hypothetical protein
MKNAASMQYANDAVHTEGQVLVHMHDRLSGEQMKTIGAAHALLQRA